MPEVGQVQGLALIGLLFFSLLLARDEQGQITPLHQAHAHNDYRHPRPLQDALVNGFCSVEADIFLSPTGELLVGHDLAELRPGRTLENLYLRPLQERARRNGGRIFPGGPSVILLIDIKTDAGATYAALQPVLRSYVEVLTEVRDEVVTPRAVTVVLSGNRPSLRELAKESPRFAAYDGRLSDLTSDVPSHLMPLISDNWALKIGWNGRGTLPLDQQRKVKEIVRLAHQRLRKVRFWATPDRPEVWRTLQDLKVDLINTDNLGGLRTTLLQLLAK